MFSHPTHAGFLPPTPIAFFTKISKSLEVILDPRSSGRPRELGHREKRPLSRALLLPQHGLAIVCSGRWWTHSSLSLCDWRASLTGPRHCAGSPPSSLFLTLAPARSRLFTSVPTIPWGTLQVTDPSDKIIQAGVLDGRVSWAPDSSCYFFYDLWPATPLFWTSEISPVTWESDTG